ncbi:MAG: HNH endonuclease signature motif containing protein, partial [Streptosporangiaceae bacterium]
HDALAEAMHRLVSAGLLPERAGQPARVWAHITLADLMVLDADSTLQKEWTERVRAQWAGHRAAASVAGGDGAAWLDGEAAEGFACDASITPVVTGEVNYTVLDDLVRLCVRLARHGRPDPDPHPDPDPAAAAPDPVTPQALQVLLSAPDTLTREALERLIIGKAVALVSGPGGLASFLRREQLGARLAGPSLPLDVGYSDDVPAGIRNAVKRRDQHCQWAGGCHQPASACEVHHLRHKGHGGVTSLDNCLLLCFFHHQVMIHRMGWTLVRHPDGTTTAWNRDQSKVLRSHSPPARAG